MKNYIGSEEHFEDSVNAYYDAIEERDQRQEKEMNEQIERDLFYSQEIEQLQNEMESDKWHVKLMRWVRLQIWLIRCNLRKKPY